MSAKFKMASEGLFPGKVIDHYETVEHYPSHTIYDVYMEDGTVYMLKVTREGKITTGRL